MARGRFGASIGNSAGYQAASRVMEDEDTIRLMSKVEAVVDDVKVITGAVSDLVDRAEGFFDKVESIGDVLRLGRRLWDKSFDEKPEAGE